MAAERYVLALLVSTQRWAPPALVLIGAIAWVWATPPVSLDTVRIVLVVLFALAGWLGHATASSEEPGQELITVSNLGSATRLLVAKGVVATVLATGFPLLLVVGTFVYGRLDSSSEPIFTVPQLLAAAVGMIAVAATGTALGLLVSSLLPGRPGWAAGLLILLSLAQAAPWMLPVPILARTLPDREQPIEPAFLIGVGLAVLSAVGLLAAARAIRRPVR